ncbi:MAG: sulfatase-like hydrolase/transferase [Phascolarctobacterium sp.]|nr:sulfatase-like hydrolase/transferase [Phascolarctobacterium sp.]
MKEYTVLGIILYIGSYLFYVVSACGAGKKAIFLQMRRYIPCAILAVLPLYLAQQPIFSSYYLAALSIAFLWIFTYPGLYYLTNHKVSLDFEFHFEAVFGYYFVSWITCILLLAHLLPSFCNIFVAAGVTAVELIVLLIPLAQIIYYILYKACINENGMLMLQETHYNEIIEFFKAMPVSINVFGFVATILSAVGFFMVNYQFLQTGLDISWLGTGILGILCIFLSIYLWKTKRGVFVRTGIGEFYLDVKEYRETNKNYKENTGLRMQNLQVKALGQPINKPHTLVLVIGESESRDYMSCFVPNYEYDTTPWMDKLSKSPNCILFPHAYSCMANTVIALSNALTEMNQYNDKKFYESCSVVDVAHKLGYKVHWYSNQGHLGCADTPVSLVAETSDVAKWTKQELNKVQYDETLLDFFAEIDPNINNLLVVHLKGNHFSFLNRFPESFTKFGKPGKYDLIPNYLDSVAYTDYVLSKIFGKLQVQIEHLH